MIIASKLKFLEHLEINKILWNSRRGENENQLLTSLKFMVMTNPNSWFRIQLYVLEIHGTHKINWNRPARSLYQFEKTKKSLISAFWSHLRSLDQSFCIDSSQHINNRLMFFSFVSFSFNWKWLVGYFLWLT